MKFIALGSPGVGKGTYTQALVKELSIAHISTGDLFRYHIGKQTPLGKKADEYIKDGNLVPDEITIEMVKERIAIDDCSKGYILDGFPRTIPQAKALETIDNIDFVLHIKADVETILSRISGRIICRDCGKIYHKINSPPKKEGECDKCQGEVYQRKDDSPESVKNRLKIYEETTAPLIEFYKEKGMLREITINEDFGPHRESIIKRLLKVINGEE